MRRFMCSLCLMAFALVATGCEKQAAAPAKPAPAPAAKPAAGAPARPAGETAAKPAAESSKPVVLAKQTVETACGSCIFHMDGVSGCKLAIKVEGKPYLVEGAKVDAHSAGLCDAAKQAEVSGEVKEGKFVASNFALKP